MLTNYDVFKPYDQETFRTLSWSSLVSSGRIHMITFVSIWLLRKSEVVDGCEKCDWEKCRLFGDGADGVVGVMR